MSKQIHKKELIQEFTSYLLVHGHSERQISRATVVCRRIFDFMTENGYVYFNEDVAIGYKNLVTSSAIKKWRKEMDLLFLRKLCDFLKGETPSVTSREKHVWDFKDVDCEIKKEFLRHLKDDRKFALSTCQSYYGLLSDFTEWQIISNICLKDLTLDAILSFVGSSKNSTYNRLLYLKKFLSFAFEHNCIKEDFSKDLMLRQPRKREKLPSYYSQEEIDVLEKSIDRSSEIGKRDYAIIELAAHLGLRASDINSLTFSNLDWDNSKVIFNQFKTKEPLELPLLAEVGNAIIDYLQNVRPMEVESKNIFLSFVPPYHPLTSSAIYGIVNKRISESGINVMDRKTGPHSLRHSLSMAMLENEVSFPTIGDVLGHASSDSTMYYLRIDITNLLRCALDVPLVDEEFYIQKGGFFYE